MRRNKCIYGVLLFFIFLSQKASGQYKVVKANPCLQFIDYAHHHSTLILIGDKVRLRTIGMIKGARCQGSVTKLTPQFIVLNQKDSVPLDSLMDINMNMNGLVLKKDNTTQFKFISDLRFIQKIELK